MKVAHNYLHRKVTMEAGPTWTVQLGPSIIPCNFLLETRVIPRWKAIHRYISPPQTGEARVKVARNYFHGKVTMGGGHTMGPQLGPPIIPSNFHPEA